MESVVSRCCFNPAKGSGILSSAARRALSACSSSTAIGFRRSSNHQRQAFYERFHSTSIPTKRLPVAASYRSLPNVSTPTSRGFHQTPALPERATRSRPKPREPIFRAPFGNVQLAELQRIFKYDVGHREGNIILRTLHERRVTGSLIDLGIRIDGAEDLPQSATNCALDWLRQRYPVDEQAAAQAWAQREVRKLEQGYIDRAERIGLYQPETDVETPSQSTADTSNSVIDEFRRYNEDRRAKEAQRREESGEAQQEQEMQLAKQDEFAQKRAMWDAKLAERKEQLARQTMVGIKGRHIEDESTPELTTLQRLLPSTLFSGACIATLLLFAAYYEPPAQGQRLFPDVPVSVATVGTIVGINLTVIVLWYLKIPIFLRAMNKFLIAVPAYPYAFSMLGNVFSHVKFPHLAANMAMTILYGISLHEELGRGNFLALYLSGGIIGSITSLYFWVLRNRLMTTHCGASGCVWAVTMAWVYLTAMKPQSSTNDPSFAMDVSRYLVATINILYHFTPGTFSTVDVIAHIAGAITGMWYAYIWRERRIKETSGGESGS